MSKIWIKNATILTMKSDELCKGDILISDGKIQAIGEVTEEMALGCEKQIDASGNLAMPGLINTHTHASMTLLRSYADDMELMPWLNDMIWPAEAKMTEDHIYWGAMLAIAEMIRGGTTCFVDMYGPFMELVAKAVEETGIRANLSRGCVGLADPTEKRITENIELYRQWHNQANGRIRVWFGPHAPYTCTPEYLKKIVAAAKSLHTGIHIHLAETQDEIRQIEETYHLRPVEYLDQCGIFDLPCLAAHAVWLTDEEIQFLANKKVAIAHNAVSNMKLSSGAAPIGKMQKAGLRIGLGTDGASSNNSLNLFKDMATAALLQKVNTFQPTALPAYEALKMATIGGAEAIDWDREIGTLEVGKEADLILVDIHQPHYCPWNHTVADLVYSAQATDVTHTIVQGRLLMEDRKILTMDVEKVMQQAARCAREICG